MCLIYLQHHVHVLNFEEKHKCYMKSINTRQGYTHEINTMKNARFPIAVYRIAGYFRGGKFSRISRIDVYS